MERRDEADRPPGNGPGAAEVVAGMKIEIWSDVACPWCYIGKRRFETALAAFPHRDSVEVQWRSYQLDPTLPEHYDGTELDYLSTRKGMAPAQVSQMFEHVAAQAKGEGLNYRFDAVVVANSFTAHRLIHLAAAHGQQDAAKERLLSDHFEHGKDIGSQEYLTALGLDLGLDAGELAELFSTDAYADAVRQRHRRGPRPGHQRRPVLRDRPEVRALRRPARRNLQRRPRAGVAGQPPAGHGGRRRGTAADAAGATRRGIRRLRPRRLPPSEPRRLTRRRRIRRRSPEIRRKFPATRGIPANSRPSRRSAARPRVNHGHFGRTGRAPDLPVYRPL